MGGSPAPHLFWLHRVSLEGEKGGNWRGSLICKRVQVHLWAAPLQSGQGIVGTCALRYLSPDPHIQLSSQSFHFRASASAIACQFAGVTFFFSPSSRLPGLPASILTFCAPQSILPRILLTTHLLSAKAPRDPVRRKPPQPSLLFANSLYSYCTIPYGIYRALFLLFSSSEQVSIKNNTRARISPSRESANHRRRSR